MPLDSDVNNADSHLHVEFYECNREGPDKGKPFVRIMIPGDKTTVIDQPVREDHKMRFQRHWLHFQMQKADGQVIGTPLSQWHTERPQELTDGQLHEMMILKFQSVEQVANATDAQLMRMGMGGNGLRERARMYLSSKNAQTAGAEMEAMKAQIAALTAALENKTDTTAPKKKPGWPKGKKRVNVKHDNAPTGAAGL